MIVGGAGSGKSTLARMLHQRVGLPVYHMDHVQWASGWVSRSRALREIMARDIESQETWIFEGGFSTTYDHRAARADMLIWLDLPVTLRLWRVTKRLFRYWGKSRPDMAEGCVEGFHRETLPFYVWIWQTRKSSRLPILDLITRHREDTQIVHLRSVKEVRVWVASL